MKKISKKIAAIVLALMTALALVPSSVFAVLTEDIVTTETTMAEETTTADDDAILETDTGAGTDIEEEAEAEKETDADKETETGTKEDTTAETDDASQEETVYEYSDDDISVTVTLSDPEDLPDDAELTVTEITGDEAEEYINALDSEQAGYSLEVEVEMTTLVYDISMTVDDVEVEPENTVTVEIIPSEELLEEIGSMEDAVVTHFTDDDDLTENEIVDATTSETAVVFETDSFSRWATYSASSEGTQYTLSLTEYNISKDGSLFYRLCEENSVNSDF